MKKLTYKQAQPFLSEELVELKIEKQSLILNISINEFKIVLNESLEKLEKFILLKEIISHLDENNLTLFTIENICINIDKIFYFKSYQKKHIKK